MIEELYKRAWLETLRLVEEEGGEEGQEEAGDGGRARAAALGVVDHYAGDGLLDEHLATELAADAEVELVAEVLLLVVRVEVVDHRRAVGDGVVVVDVHQTRAERIRLHHNK